MHDEIKDQTTFNKGEPVPEGAEYICVPCGFKKQYEKGETFGECLSCMAGSQGGPHEFAEGLELWEKL